MKPPAIEVVVADDAFEQLAGCVQGRALLVMDTNSRAAAGERLATTLRDSQTLVLERSGGLLAGLDEVGLVEHRIGTGTTPVAVGSGVITDIVRYAAHRAGVPFISVPTAASMDGYASSVAALQIEGVKVTYPARPPAGIFADPRVLADAPLELTRAGIGDLLAKATAGVDWLAAHVLYGEPFDSVVADGMGALVDNTVRAVDDLLGGDRSATRRLLLALIESGLAIARVRSSRPASGCEHHASHFWDLQAARGRRPHHLHGLQVGYATHFAMALQAFAFGPRLGELRAPAPWLDPLDGDARTWLEPVTEELLAATREKQSLLAVAPGRWPAPSQWQSHRRRLTEAMGPFEQIRAALERAGIPSAPGFLGIDRAQLTATFRYSNRLRARYTVLDFLEGQGQLEQALAVAVS